MLAALEGQSRPDLAKLVQETVPVSTAPHRGFVADEYDAGLGSGMEIYEL